MAHGILDQIIESILDPTSKGMSGNTLIVANHLQQMKLFSLRGGVEILPTQDDDYDSRKKFIDNIWKQNQLDLYLDKIWDFTLLKGQILLYLRPTKDGTYKIYFYPKDSFRAYYNSDGDLAEVVIRYNFKVRGQFDNAQNLHWIKLRITSETVEQTETDQQPSFDGEYLTSMNAKTYTNTLKFIPCVVVRNAPTGPGEDGVCEFEHLRSQIETHDKLMGAINANLAFFGNPSLVTTRSPTEIMEAIEDDTPALNKSRTLSSAGGWYGDTTNSSRKQDPFAYRAGQEGIRVKRVVGNVSNDERFGYIAPDPISPDHTQHVREMREAIHFALGGIDERGMTATATAYEMKSIYGRVAATAIKKCRAIYDHGLCKLFEMALAAEEDLFKQSLAVALKKTPEEMTEGFIQDLTNKGKIPPNVFGLPPIGNRQIKWRWTGPVFEPSPTDMRDKTIAARNYQELGVRSLESLKTIFDNKTDKELEGMLKGGYPFRYMSSVGNTTSQFLGLYQQMLNLPNGQGQSLAQTVQMPPLISRSIDTLYKELNYDPRFDAVQPGDIPDYRVGASSYSNFLSPGGGAIPGAAGSTTPAGTSSTIPGISNAPSPLAASGILPFPVQTFGGQPMETGVRVGNILPEYAADLPISGSTVTIPNTPIAGGLQPNQSILSSQLPPGSAIPPDLAVGAEQPGSIWSQLFPTVAAATSKLRKHTSKK